MKVFKLKDERFRVRPFSLQAKYPNGDTKFFMQIRSSQLLVNDDGNIIMGTGRMTILETLDRTGSINKTAKELNMSYKTVWSKIKSTEENFGKAVVLADRKKGTRLTSEGRSLLETYRELKQRCIREDDRIFDEIFQKKNPDHL